MHSRVEGDSPMNDACPTIRQPIELYQTSKNIYENRTNSILNFDVCVKRVFICIYWTLFIAYIAEIHFLLHEFRLIVLSFLSVLVSLYLALAASAKSISGQFLAISIVLCLLWHKSCFKTVALTSSRLWKIELSRIGWNIGLLSADELFPVNRGCFKKLLDSTYGNKPKYIWLRST